MRFEKLMLRDEVATHAGRPVVYEFVRKPPVDEASAVSAVDPEPKRSEPSATEVRPVPPLVTSKEPVVSESAMPRDDVARAVGTATPLVTFASTELAAMVERPMVAFEPPMREPSVPETFSGPETASDVVATFANVFALEKYGMLPTTAAEEVLRPL